MLNFMLPMLLQSSLIPLFHGSYPSKPQPSSSQDFCFFFQKKILFLLLFNQISKDKKNGRMGKRERGGKRGGGGIVKKERKKKGGIAKTRKGGKGETHPNSILFFLSGEFNTVTIPNKHLSFLAQHGCST